MEFVEHYFKWWGANGDILNKEEYEQYEKPLDLMVTLTVLYENQAQNFSKIVSIMQKIQECGAVQYYPSLGLLPRDIVADMFPGLYLNTMG